MSITLKFRWLLNIKSVTELKKDPGIPRLPDLKEKIRNASKRRAPPHYLRTLHKVIDESDIIILVLDARDPEGCRSRLVEEEVRRREMEGKKLVFVLNKIGVYWIVPSLNGGNQPGYVLRPDTTRECAGVAQASPTLNTNTPISLIGVLAPTYKYLVVHRPIPPQTTQGIQTEGWKCHSGRCGISKCWKEQLDQ